MEEKELIKRIQLLKNVKPNKNWVIFVKSQIFEFDAFAVSAVEGNNYKEKILSVLRRFLPNAYRGRLAYALAALLFVVLGFGMWYNVPITEYSSEQSKLVINGRSDDRTNDVKATIEDFNKKSQNLAQIVKDNPTDKKRVLAVKEVKAAAKSLTDFIQKKPSLIKEVALELKNNKTFLVLDKDEADLKEASDLLYKTLDEQMIKDLENATLTEEQQNSLQEIKILYAQEKYSQALEKILLIP